MTFKDIAISRLNSQQVADTNFKTAKDIVSWMGALQAQDYNMAKWAIGIRLPGSTENVIETAINKGEIIRTHLLRPTWHFVSAKDIYWMLELTAPHIKASLKFRHKYLELTAAILKKSNKIFEKALRDGKHLTRNELVSELEKAKVDTSDQRAAHMLLLAELDKIICSGATSGTKITYALFAERIPQSKKLNRDEALAALTKKYFKSHGPATLQDYIWWSGLPVADVKRAMEMVKADFISEKIDLQTYWFPNTSSIPATAIESVYLLPAFDEFIISYKDRSACLPSHNHPQTISNNGIFRPVIVANGQVAGIWKRTIKKDKTIIETQFFSRKNPQQNKTFRNLIEKASVKLGNFLNQKIEIV